VVYSTLVSSLPMKRRVDPDKRLLEDDWTVSGMAMRIEPDRMEPAEAIVDFTWSVMYLDEEDKFPIVNY